MSVEGAGRGLAAETAPTIHGAPRLQPKYLDVESAIFQNVKAEVVNFGVVLGPREFGLGGAKDATGDHGRLGLRCLGDGLRSIDPRGRFR